MIPAPRRKMPVSGFAALGAAELHINPEELFSATPVAPWRASENVAYSVPFKMEMLRKWFEGNVISVPVFALDRKANASQLFNFRLPVKSPAVPLPIAKDAAPRREMPVSAFQFTTPPEGMFMVPAVGAILIPLPAAS